MGAAHSNVMLKLFLIGFLVLALMIPMFLTSLLVEDRKGRHAEAAGTIHQQWGGPQRVAGPLLTLPYDWVGRDAEGKAIVRRQVLRVLPEDLTVDGTLEPEIRRRGNFETPVYLGQLKLSASFRLPDPHRFQIDPERIHWQEATLRFGLSNLRGLDTSPVLTWQGQPLELEAESDPSGPFPSALVARLDALPLFAQASPETRPDLETGPQRVELDLAVRGASRLAFLPLGRETRVSLSAPWGNPSFQGAFLPRASEIGDQQFEAEWSIPHFARSFPQTWIDRGDPQPFDTSTFGVELLFPVDFYQQVSRCTKYALLFLALTFGVFFLFELLQGLRIHPVQYGMVGLAMCLFYLLLLALAEHLGFATAYLVAALATAGLITTYSATVLRTRGRAATLGASLGVLYGVLFVLVQLQTYALLVGAVSLFLALAAAMALTRNVDWYDLGRGRRASPDGLDPVAEPG